MLYELRNCENKISLRKVFSSSTFSNHCLLLNVCVRQVVGGEVVGYGIFDAKQKLHHTQLNFQLHMTQNYEF
jgi:hypothetical protein